MTEKEIREAGAQAVADFPALSDEVAARLGALLADLNDQPTDEQSIRKERAA